LGGVKSESNGGERWIWADFDAHAHVRPDPPVRAIADRSVFLPQVKMCDVEEVDLLDKRGYLTICLSLNKDGKVYLRKTEGIREWHRNLKVSGNFGEFTVEQGQEVVNAARALSCLEGEARRSTCT